MDSKTKGILSIISAALILGITSNCSSGDNEIDLSSIGGTPTANEITPLVISMTLNLNGLGNLEDVIFNETGTNECAASVAVPEVTCTADIPEGRLYFSELNVTWSFLPTSCLRATYIPSKYPASNNAAYDPPGGDNSTIDCSGLGTGAEPSQCWGGSAPQVVTTFPIDDALVQFPNEADLNTATSGVATIPSGFFLGAGSNRTTATDLTGIANPWFTPPVAVGAPANTDIAALGGGAGDGYLGATQEPLTGHFFICRDQFEELQPYRINLVITETDGATNDYNSFKEE